MSSLILRIRLSKMKRYKIIGLRVRLIQTNENFENKTTRRQIKIFALKLRLR